MVTFTETEKKIEEPYIMEKATYAVKPVKIKSDEVYVLGDNRNNSSDSSIWGPVPVSSVHARILFRYWPIKRFKTL